MTIVFPNIFVRLADRNIYIYIIMQYVTIFIYDVIVSNLLIMGVSSVKN